MIRWFFFELPALLGRYDSYGVGVRIGRYNNSPRFPAIPRTALRLYKATKGKLLRSCFVHQPAP